MNGIPPDHDAQQRIRPWLVRIPEVFENISADVLRAFGGGVTTRLGADYHLIREGAVEAIRCSDASKFASWNLPMEHTWPCNPRRMERFVERAARTLAEKFGGRNPQGIFIGRLNPGSPDRYYKTLASNLRGRTLQLFAGLAAATPEEQDPARETLFCLLGKEGLFCGMSSPLAANGLHAGGSKFIDTDAPGAISRAGAKIAEALHFLQLHRPRLPAGSRWLELGAAPGGMTAELLQRGYRVTAIDRASLDPRLDNRAGLTFVQADVADFTPARGELFDGLLCDLNGPPEDAVGHVIRLARFLEKPGLVVFTLKLPRVESMDVASALFRQVVEGAERSGLRLFARTHLTCNRHEFTLFFACAPTSRLPIPGKNPLEPAALA